MENLIQPASVLDQQRPVQPFLMPNLLHLCNAGMLIARFCDHTGGVTGSHITEYEHCEGYKQNHRHHGQDTLENVFSHKILLYADLLDHASSLCAMTRNFLP